MSDLQAFIVSYQPGHQPPWPDAPKIEDDIPPQEQQPMMGTLSEMADPTRIHYKRVRKSLYDLMLRITPSGYQADFPSTSSNFGYLKRRLNASSAAVKNSVDMNLQIMHGNPVFRGTRIPIYQIIEELADGTPLREIPEGYPTLTLEQIRSGLDFAASVLRIYDDQISSR